MSHQKSLITGYWLKKTAQPKNGEVFYLANFLKPSSLECSLLLSSEELLPRGKGGDRIWRSFCNNDQIVIKRWPLIKENQTSQVKQFSVFLCMGRCKSLCSLKSFLFCASQLSGARFIFFPILGSPSGPTAAADGLMATASFVCCYGRQHFTSTTAASIIIMKVWNTVTIPNCDTETGSEQRLLKNGTDRLLLGVTNLQSVNAISMKHNKAKHNKMMCICILSWHKILFFFNLKLQSAPTLDPLLWIDD